MQISLIATPPRAAALPVLHVRLCALRARQVRARCAPGAHQVTDSPLAMVMVSGENCSSPPSPPSFTVAALADRVSSRLAAPASAKEAAFCGGG
jgi:hypothetical protein